METEIVEYAFEYFPNHPVIFALAATISFILCLTGVVGNSVVILVKFLKNQERNGLEVLVLNMMFLMIITSLLIVLAVLDEINHNIENPALCAMREFLHDFGVDSKMFSFISLILVARYFPNITQRTALIIILAIWSLTIIFSFPKVSHELLSIQLANGKFRNVCTLAGEVDAEEWESDLRAIVIKRYFIPAIVIIGSSLWILFTMVEDNSSRWAKNIQLYSITVACFYCLAKVPLGFFEGFYIWDFHVNFGILLWIAVICDMLVVINPIAYCYFERSFFKDIRDVYLDFYRSSEERRNFENSFIENEQDV